MNSTTLSSFVSEPRAQPAQTARLQYIDVFRGVLMAYMALDHASLLFNPGRLGEELSTAAPQLGTLGQFLTRFGAIPVPPSFFMISGFLAAMTSLKSEHNGRTPAQVNAHFLLRGLVLIAVDAIIMGLPRAIMGGFYTFNVLSSIGAATILMVFIRKWPSTALVVLGVAFLIAGQFVLQIPLPVPVAAILDTTIREGAFRSLYPIIPWAGVYVLGYVLGRDALTREHKESFWYSLGLGSAALFAVIRLAGGWGNAYSYTTVNSMSFWLFAKYPPDLAFLTWAAACGLGTLATVALLTRKSVPWLLRPLEIIGRVPLFFYVVHFYALGMLFAVIRRQVSLPITYAIWAAVLTLMVPMCSWYADKKLHSPNIVTRNF